MEADCAASMSVGKSAAATQPTHNSQAPTMRGSAFICLSDPRLVQVIFRMAPCVANLCRESRSCHGANRLCIFAATHGGCHHRYRILDRKHKCDLDPHSP